MSRENTLRTAAAELAAGDLASALAARQRLTGLLGTYPTDLEVRERLAAAHRLLGDPAQAGRWNYLSPDADPTETAAFERAFPTALERARALRWPLPEQDAPTPSASARLLALRTLAEEETDGPLSWEALRKRPGDAGDEAPPKGAVMVGLVFAAVLLLALTCLVWGGVALVGSLISLF
ncbi:hypothetical protein OG897_03725 [Streptomyces sp. NBC_00237]|uniref:DUF6584 family protein n=1 Tax=Streptomyces sp. NBC_00237 TaxID=2975687 RepID=UPI002256F57C|nr:DUF6584 family protein [Streptomyces sp. NBC_00237]MCX5200575.1 hypothetical protein [Streptomyces sp. NBC_00237]